MSDFSRETSSRETFRVVFWGDVAAGQSRREVALKFARRFRISDSKQLKRIFSGRLLTLKRGLSAADAQRYCKVITELGANCRMEREAHALAGGDWGGGQPEPRRPRHTAFISFDTLGFGAQDFSEPEEAPEGDVSIEGSRDPFGVRDVSETEHPPVKYYDGRPVRRH